MFYIFLFTYKTSLVDKLLTALGRSTLAFNIGHAFEMLVNGMDECMGNRQ